MVEKYASDMILEDLHKAFLDARKGGKRRTMDENKFELRLWDNLVALRDELMNRTYKPSSGIAFINFKPVVREIFAAPFRDRVIHHYLFNIVAEWWDKQFIYDSCACRKGKGTHFAVKRLEHHIRSVSDNFKRPTWVYKFDLKGYFMSMNREKLYYLAIKGLDKQFPESKRGTKYWICRHIWKAIIFDEPTEGVKKRGCKGDWSKLPWDKSLFNQRKGIGIVIGNLTSQLLSNILMNEFDRYVTMALGYKHYVRYVDDFAIVIPEEDKAKLEKDIEKMERFLADKLRLTLHPNKRYRQEIHKGVEFIGARIFAGYKLPSRRIERNFYKTIKGFMMGRKGCSAEAVMAFLGMMDHYKSVDILRKGCRMAEISYGGLMRAKKTGGNELREFLLAEKERRGKAKGNARAVPRHQGKR